MPDSAERDVLRRLIREQYGDSHLGGKAIRYIDKFFAAELRGGKLIAKVVGNQGTYTVSIALAEDTTRLISVCSCYIGKHGGCHHVVALAHAFLRDESQFEVIDVPKSVGASLIEGATNFDELLRALRETSLDSLLQQLREAGITQKAFAEAIGMKPSMLTVYKSSEARHHYFSELGAVKLACLWMLQRCRKRNWKG